MDSDRMVLVDHKLLIGRKFPYIHSWLVEELMIPNVNKMDLNRVNMVSNHLNQFTVLARSELPRVFTGLENQIGSHSPSAFRLADDDYVITNIIVKNKYNTLYIIKSLTTNKYDAVKISNAEHITENYGYEIFDKLKDKTEQTVIKKGEVLFKTASYDDNMNFKYGVNLNTIYTSYKHLTYQDGIVVSESAAEKLRSYDVRQVTISVNNNDLLLNIYGDDNNYKSFPDIGESIVKRILCSRRRINYNESLIDLKNENLSRIFDNDVSFYSQGQIVDIDVYCNRKIEDLENLDYNNQLLKYLKDNKRYNSAIIFSMGEIIANSGNVTDEFMYIYNSALKYNDYKIKWIDENEFDNITIKFKIMYQKKIVKGSKITNRYGAKGVVTAIIKDEDMPLASTGERAELMLSPLSVINRTNVPQLFEHELNFIAYQLQSKISKMMNESIDNATEVFKMILKFFRLTDSDTFNYLMHYMRGNNDIIKLINLFITYGFYIKQNPFHDNIDIFKLAKLYEIFPFVEKYKFNCFEIPLVMGKMYFIRLKHDPFSKFSVRSTHSTSIKKIPYKSKAFKNNQIPFNKTAIRNGEMENNNLLLLGDVDEVIRFIKTYSSNDAARRGSVKHQLTAVNSLIEKIDVKVGISNIIVFLEQYFNALGLGIYEKDNKIAIYQKS